MIDLILFSVLVGAFFGGFWCGKTYQTVNAMASDIYKRIFGKE